MKPHEANRAFWDASARWWKEKEDQRGLWVKAHEDPALVLSPAEMLFLKDVDSKDVCVLGSGDNEVAFALAGLGAHVTSVDISERRLAVAAERARTLGLQLTFLRADVTDLSALEDNSFDLVYTGGHMSVWISDIQKYYAEAVRILKPDGLFVVNEYHPVRRMWVIQVCPLKSSRILVAAPQFGRLLTWAARARSQLIANYHIDGQRIFTTARNRRRDCSQLELWLRLATFSESAIP